MGELSSLQNIGKALEAQLEQVGIYTADQLRQSGSQEAWLKIRAIDDSACINRLMALEGAIRNMRWHNLPPEVKVELKAFYQSAK